MGPIYQHSHHHKSNCQKASTSCTQIWHLCMYDPYTSTHTIIRVTVKFRHQLAPRFGTSVCMTHIPALNHHKSNCQKASPPRPQIWHLYVRPIYKHSTIIRVTVKKRHHLTPRFGTCIYDPYTSTQPS